jgi:membrane protease YdiL (CAAX protease family)
MLPIDQVIVTVLPLAIVLLAGIVPSRYEPQESFLAHQRWGYRHFIAVWFIFTASQFVPLPRMVMAWRVWLWTLSYGFTAIVIIVSVWGAVRWNQSAAWRALGFDRATALQNVLWALRIVFALASVVAVLGLLTRLAIPNVDGRGTLGLTTEWRDQVGAFLALYGVRTIAIPLAEEMLFRGLAYGPLYRKFGVSGAAIGSALLWAIVHYAGPSYSNALRMGVLLVVGIIYAEVYRRRASLVPTVTFHIAFNTTGVLVRVSDLGTLIPATAAVIGLWVISVVLFRVSSHARATAKVDI